MRTYKFRSEFTYELPDQTLTIVATGQMTPGWPGTYWEPPESPEFACDPNFEITCENGEKIDIESLPETAKDEIWELAYDRHEAIKEDNEI